MPSPGSLHIDQALTMLSVMYRNAAFHAEEILPALPVNKRSNKYFVHTKEDFLSITGINTAGKSEAIRAPGTRAAEITYSVSTDSYFCDEYALAAIVPDADVALADNPLQPDMDQTTQLTERITLEMEYAAASLAMKRANFPSSNKVVLTTGGSGTSWASGSYASANSNPITDIKNGKQAVRHAIIRDPNVFALTVDAARNVADHPKITGLLVYVSKDNLTNNGLPPVVKGLQVLELVTQMNTAAAGLTGNYTNVWCADDGTEAALIFYKNPNPTLRSVAFGYSFEAPDDATGQRGFSVRRWRDEPRKGNMIECSVLRDWKGVAVDGSGLLVGGYLISSATV